MSVEKLYEAVKTGRIRPDQLNEKGKMELGSFIQTRQQPETYGDSALSSRALQNEKVQMMGSKPNRAPALSVPAPQPVNPQRQKTIDFINDDPDNPTLKFIKDNTVDAWANLASNFTYDTKPGQFVSRMSNAGLELMGGKPTVEATTGNKTADKIADVAGTIGGAFVNPSNLQQSFVGVGLNNPLTQKAAAFVGSKISNPLASRTATEATRGALAGAFEGGAMAFTRGDNAPQIAAETAIGGSVGGVLGGAAPAAGDAIKRLIGVFRPQQSASQSGSILALPEPQQRGNVNRAQTPDVINASGKVEPIGLPEPNIAPPTTARVSRQVNPARDKLEAFAQSIQGIPMPPGREREAFLEAWGRFAGPNDPDLETMIDLAYQPRPNRITPDLAQRARESQRMREVAGVGMPVQSFSDRYQGGVTGRAAMPETVVGRNGPPTRTEPPVQTREQAASIEMPPNGPTSQTPDFNPQNAFQRAATSLRQMLGNTRATDNISAFVGKADYTNPKDTRSRIVSKTRAERTNLQKSAERLYRGVVDNIQDINRFDKAVESQLGQKLNPSDRAYMLALNSRGSDVISKHILTENLVDAKGNFIGQSLKQVMRQIPKGRHLEFEDYLLNKHAITRMSRGENVYPNHTTEELAERVAHYERTYPVFKDLAQQYYDFNNKMGKAWLVDTGIMSQEMWDAWRRENPFYVPMKRAFSDLEQPRGFGGSKRGFAGQSNPVKKAAGSNRKIISPTESTIEYTDKFVKTAKRNEVMQALVRNVQKDPEAFKDIVEIVSPDESFNVSKILSEDGVEGLVEELGAQFEKAAKKPDLSKGNIVRGIVNGQPVHLRIHDIDLLQALTHLDPGAQNAVVEFVRKGSNMVKFLTTGGNIVFSLGRNLFRDIPMAYVASKTTANPARFAYDLLEGFISSLGNGKLYQSFKAVGGGHASAVAADRNLLAQSKRELMPKSLNPKTMVQALWHGYENFNNAIEAAPRLGEFKRITKAGGDNYDSKVKGLYEANDVTVNFKRAGNIAKDVDPFVLYLNAALQGLDKIGRIYKDNPVKATAKSIGTLTMPAILLYAINHDRKEYKELSNHVKDNYMLVPLADGKFFKIAKPREGGTVFITAVERALRAWKDKDPAAFKDFAQTVKNNFAPPGVGGLVTGEPLTNAVRDTILGPIVEVGMNKNFADAPIVPGSLEGVSPRHQFNENTSEVSKFIGDKLNYSPMKIDYLARGYGGVIGQLGIPATSRGSSAGETLEKLFVADPVYSNDFQRDFYDQKDKLDTANKDFKLTGEMPKEMNEGMRQFYGDINNILGDLRQQSRAIDQNPLLSDQQKKDKMREIQVMMNDILRKTMGR